jgi:hypothetical protein
MNFFSSQLIEEIQNFLNVFPISTLIGILSVFLLFCPTLHLAKYLTGAPLLSEFWLGLPGERTTKTPKADHEKNQATPPFPA